MIRTLGKIADDFFNVQVENVRERIVEGMKEVEAIGPSEWSKIDMAAHFMVIEMTKCMHDLMKLVMTRLNEAGATASNEEVRDIVDAQLVISAMSSLLAAHFEVSVANGRTQNDAHLHLDRVLRAAKEMKVEVRLVG